jgi:hypothetical protein
MSKRISRGARAPRLALLASCTVPCTGTTADGGRKMLMMEIRSMPPPRPSTAVSAEEWNAAMTRRVTFIL